MWQRTSGGGWDESGGGGVRYSQVFMANSGQGKAKAEDEGYVSGETMELNGVLLTLQNVQVSERDGFDQVTVWWTTTAASVSKPQQAYNDNVVRKPGEEEWHFEAELDGVEPRLGVSYDGKTYNGGEWACDEDSVKSLDQPSVVLVGRKWMSKNQAVPGENPTTLPISRTKAIDAVTAYLPNATVAQKAKYETGCPTLMCLLAGTSEKFMCTSIVIEKDGDLVCRTARFKYNPKGWNVDVGPGYYGPEWPAS